MTEGWQMIWTVPKTGDVVLFWDGTRYYTGRADDWHYKAVYLDKVTHWTTLPKPPPHDVVIEAWKNSGRAPHPDCTKRSKNEFCSR